MTLAGTVSELLFERRETVAPPEPALKFKRTSPEAEAPPMMGLGLSNNPPNKGDTVRVFCPTPEAVIRTRVSDFTGGLAAVVMVNVAVVDLPCTVTLAGTLASEVMLLVRLTTVPPMGAGLGKVTVPVGVEPFWTSRDESVSEYCGGGGLNGAMPLGNGR